MRLQVIEKSENFLNNISNTIVSTFDFNNKISNGKLNYGTVFQAELKKDKSVDVSLVRKVDNNTYETYASQTLFASNNVVFDDRTSTTLITMTFQLIK